MKKKNLIFIICLFLVILSSHYSLAQTQNFTLAISYKWLNKTINEKFWDSSNLELGYDGLALTILALGNGNYNIKTGVDKLKELQSDDGSWNNGNIVYTSWATYALYKTNNDVSKAVKWLLDKQIQASTTGNWYVQIKTLNSGKCIVSLNDGEGAEFEVDSGGVNCNTNGINTWIDLENCANFNIGANDTVSVNCNDLGNADISLIYKQDNAYYILDSKASTRFVAFKIDNTYYGDYESTAYASWVLVAIGKESQLYTLPYLRSNMREGNNLDRAMLLMITNNNNYAEYLAETQNNFTGSWDEGNVYNTAFIVYALKKQGKSQSSVKSGVDWLKGEQISNNPESPKYGSWNSDIRESAMAIYAISGDTSKARTGGTSGAGVCGNKIVEGTEECDATYVNGTKEGDDSNCESTEKCVRCICRLDTSKECSTAEDCGSAIYVCVSSKCQLKAGYCESSDDCSTDEECDTSTNKCKIIKPECTSDTECGEGKECSSGKCIVITGFCKSNADCDKGEKCNKKINRCEKGGGFPLWIIALVLIVVLGALFFFIKKGGIRIKMKKEQPQPRYQPSPFKPSQPIRPVMQPRPIQPPSKNYADEKLEKELDASIKKAKEILGKK